MKNGFDNFLFDSAEAEEVYYDSIDDKYWKEISTKFPQYNSINTQDHLDAVEYILAKMMQEYDELDWSGLKSEMMNKIKDAIS